MMAINFAMRVSLSALVLFSITANAALTDFLNETSDYQYTFAVYDIRPAKFSSSVLEETLTTAIRTYADKARVSHSIPPQNLPNGAPKMILQKISRGNLETYNPQCYGEIISINSLDTGMAKYGELTGSKACIFKYKDGYRVNYFGQFLQKTGADSVEKLGASLGRMFTKAVGLGDSSRFMKDTLDKFEKDIKVAGADVKLVELYPAMETKVVLADPAPPISQAEQSASANQGGGSQFVTGEMPPQLTALQAMIASNPEVQAALAQQRRAAQSYSQPQATPAVDFRLQARKDLSAMGLIYHSQDQFIESIKRGDSMAVELFLKAGAVDVTAATADKKLMDGHPEILSMLIAQNTPKTN
jgi:hypothetical protein